MYVWLRWSHRITYGPHLIHMINIIMLWAYLKNFGFQVKSIPNLKQVFQQGEDKWQKRIFHIFGNLNGWKNPNALLSLLTLSTQQIGNHHSCYEEDPGVILKIQSGEVQVRRQLCLNSFIVCFRVLIDSKIQPWYLYDWDHGKTNKWLTWRSL